jgi:hypothetical protein
MRRYHLFEWEDQPWLPVILRDYLTDHLRFVLSWDEARPLHLAISSILRPAMARLGTREIVDLCSGGGGPLLAVQRYLRTEMRFETTVTLTDLYPNIAALKEAESSSNGGIRTCRESVSAFDVPSDLDGIRTLFTAFHHFRPNDARRILQDAASKRRGIAVFEPFERSPRMAASLAVAGIVLCPLLMPRIGRISLGRFALTYLVPLAPAVAAWDACVSSLRCYTVPELRDLAASVSAEGFTWEAGQLPVSMLHVPAPLTYLIGLPD